MDTPQVTPVVKSKRELLLFALSGLGTILAGLGTLPVDSADLPLPPEWRPYIISIGFFAVTLERWLKVVQGIVNRWLSVMPAFLLFAGMLSLNSCAVINSGITGEKLTTAPVQRVTDSKDDAKPFQVIKSDIDRAEANPEIMWGLYNAGLVQTYINTAKKSPSAYSSNK